MKKRLISLLGLVSLVLMVGCQFDSSVELNTNPPVEWTENAVIYEVNVRQYTEEGTFNAFAEQLPRLQKMGVDILWLMPIHPIGEKNRKGSLGSYYSIKDYKGVNPEFGNLEDFKSLVDKAHDLGMYVILDWVANHTAWDHHWMETNPEYYELNEEGEMFAPYDWSDVVSLEYNNEDMREEMLEAMKYWVEEADIDGYRCDVASEVPTDFWNKVRVELDDIKPVFMLAESEETDILENAFDANYGWEFHHIMNSVVKGEKGKKDILEYFKKEKKNTPSRAYKMYFITNHDENSWNGTIEERLGPAADAMSIMTFTLDCMPLIYSGQESANTKRLAFFEKDLIKWRNYSKINFYQKLAFFKHKYPALWNGQHGGTFKSIESNNDHVLAYSREKDGNEVLVMINLSGETFDYHLTNVDLSEFNILMSDNVKNSGDKNSFSLLPWGYRLYVKKVKVAE